MDEAPLIALFVPKERRERLVTLAKSRRADFVNDFLHDTRRLRRELLVPLEDVTVESALREMRARGARKLAWVICADTDFDARELPLDEALRAVVGREIDALVFAVGARVAYYENHEGERYLVVAP